MIIPPASLFFFENILKCVRKKMNFRLSHLQGLRLPDWDDKNIGSVLQICM